MVERINFMLLKVKKSDVSGNVTIPGSKSHTIRSLFIAALSDGDSVIRSPLISGDALSAVNILRALGASIEVTGDAFNVKGFGGTPIVPEDIVNVGNSGTSLRFASVTAALTEGFTVFTGDYQIRRRPMGPLIEAINKLGGQAFSTRGTGTAPVIVGGRIKGGIADLDSVTSQYLSALLVNAPLFEKDTQINILRLNEVPYAEMTLWWLDKQNIAYQNDDFRTIKINGGQKYKAFQTTIPGDFSSATFFAVQAAVSGNRITMKNLDMTDPQGDKRVLAILESMGAGVEYHKDAVSVEGRYLRGIEIDMNSIPDALPAIAVAGCFASGETRLLNVPQARLKETDRISVMCTELRKMGADIEELPDGLIIRESKLKGCVVNGHDDHRVVMALAVAGLNTEGDTVIETAEAMKVTFPKFADYMCTCGADMELIDQEEKIQ